VFLVLSGALVGLAAGIMGVGGGFLTFPIFVYMLGVSSMTTVGTDIFQIVFTAGYASISQYAIYGFIFYTLAMGMLLGSLLGIQIGAMVTKVVPGITIRGFYAMAVLAGFRQPVFRPARQTGRNGGDPYLQRDLGHPGHHRGLGLFHRHRRFRHLGDRDLCEKHRTTEGGGRTRMIANKSKFYTGFILMILFTAVFICIFMPLFGGKNGLEFLDNLYNSISKGSAYYIDTVRTDVGTIQPPEMTVKLTMKSEVQAQQTMPLFIKSGAQVGRDGAHLTVTGNLIQVLSHCLDDAQAMYNNDGVAVSAKYGYAEKAVLYNWWSALKAMDFDLKRQKKFNAARIAEMVNKKAVETAYNYYGIEGQKISERFGVVLFSLIFYVVYTLWYGFGIMYLFEGSGLQLEH
jgi:hypothetical protein